MSAQPAYVSADEGAAFAELDCVRVLRDVVAIDGSLVSAGSIGAIVAIWAGGSAFTVEFASPRQLLAEIDISDVVIAAL